MPPLVAFSALHFTKEERGLLLLPRRDGLVLPHRGGGLEDHARARLLRDPHLRREHEEEDARGPTEEARQKGLGSGHGLPVDGGRNM